MREWVGGAKHLVKAGLARAVVCAGWHAKSLVAVVEASVGALQQRELCQDLKAGNVFLSVFNKEGPRLADVVHRPGAGEPEERVGRT